MRSARKFSVNPMSAIPGRLMSLIVMGTRDSRLSERSSSESCSFCCSKSCETVSVTRLVELKQPHLAVLKAVRDPESLAIALLEHEDRLPALQERAGRFFCGEREPPGPLPNDLNRGIGPRKPRGLRGGLEAHRRAALLPVLHLVLEPKQRLFLFVEHRVQSGARIRVDRLSEKVDRVPVEAELGVVPIAFLRHHQIASNQPGIKTRKALDPLHGVLSKIRRGLPMAPFDRDLHAHPLLASASLRHA